MNTVLVVAGVLVEDGRVLLSRRKAGSHLEGMWEFPGGKVDAGESPTEALVRELREELGIEVIVDDILDVAFHRYEEAKKAVLLLFYRVRRTAASGPPQALDVAEFRWCTEEFLDPARFPPADVAVLQKTRALL